MGSGRPPQQVPTGLSFPIFVRSPYGWFGRQGCPAWRIKSHAEAANASAARTRPPSRANRSKGSLLKTKRT